MIADPAFALRGFGGQAKSGDPAFALRGLGGQAKSGDPTPLFAALELPTTLLAELRTYFALRFA